MKLAKNSKTTVKKAAAPSVARTGARPVKPATTVVARQEVQPAKPVASVVAREENQLTKPAPPATPARPVTVIEAKIDVGFGNKLFVRGQGAGLSWERGTPLTCVGPDTWRWTVEATDRLKFKLLLNDRVWATGEDVVVPPGKQVELKPAFSE